MKLISRLLFPHRRTSAPRAKLRGLSTAELVGIIVIVGILGALGGTYITGMITQSKTNTGNQNAQSLTTTLSSAIAGGATMVSGGLPASGQIDSSSPVNTIASLNTGVQVGGVTYQMNPPIANAASYTLTGNTFSYTVGSAP